MTGQDKISILITFIIGGFVGAYVYVAGFAPTYRLPEAVTQDRYTDLVIVADSYGACAETQNCLSFQLLQDGSYRALYGTPAISYEGTIPRSQRRQLGEVVATTTLAAVMSDGLEECYFGDDDANLRFIITVAGENYLIDSCTSDLDYEGVLWQSLYNLFVAVAEGE